MTPNQTTDVATARCSSVSEIKPLDLDQPLRCLLVGPHFGYRHYAAFPFKPERFWTWDDKHPAHPCPSPDCSGDGRYAPPGKGHYAGCRWSTYLPAMPNGEVS